MVCASYQLVDSDYVRDYHGALEPSLRSAFTAVLRSLKRAGPGLAGAERMFGVASSNHVAAILDGRVLMRFRVDESRCTIAVISLIDAPHALG